MKASVLLLAACTPHPVSLSDGHTGPGPALISELANTGGLRSRLAEPDDADLVLLYGGEQGGWMGVCGCDARPLGSLARVEGYRRALPDEPPVLLLDAGGWLDDAKAADGALRADVDLSNAAMVQGLSGWDALNVADPDLPWLSAHGFPDQAVSASLSGVPSVRVLDAGLTVAVTGVAGEGAVAAVEAVLPVDADLVVVLAHDVGRQARELARLEGVDVLVEAGGFSERYPPVWDGAAVWVRTDDETRRLGELRLVVEDGRVVAAKDRLIDLDDRIPSDRRLRALHEDTIRRVDTLQQELFAAP